MDKYLKTLGIGLKICGVPKTNNHFHALKEVVWHCQDMHASAYCVLKRFFCWSIKSIQHMKTEHLFCNFKDIMSGLDVENNESEFIKPQIITTVPKHCTFTLK